jgi:hypothetical protein
MFGLKRRPQMALASAPALPMMMAPEMPATDLAPMVRPKGMFGSAAPVSLDVADVGASLTPTRSVQGMPRPSYNGPAFNRMQVLGAMLQQMGDNRGQLNDLYAREDKTQRGDYDAAMTGLDRVQQTEPLDRLQAGMGQDERDLFAVAPEMALRRMHPEPQKIDPIALAKLQLDREKFGYEQQKDATLTPAQRAQFGMQSRQFDLDLAKYGFETGKAQDAKSEKIDKLQRSAQSQFQRQALVLQDIARAKTLASPGTTGLVGGVMKNVGGTSAADLSALVDTIGANIGFKELQDMRDNSPTGGALGQVTERELALLQAVSGSLKQSQSQMQFRQNLNRLEDQYKRSMENIAGAYEQDFGRPMPGAQPAGPQRATDLPPGVKITRVK